MAHVEKQRGKWLTSFCDHAKSSLLTLRHRPIPEICVLAIVFWVVLYLLLAPADFQEGKELTQLWAQIVAAVGLFIGAHYAWRRIEVARGDQVIAREGQITERFTRAIDQLGKGALEVRLGGIYALERIAKDSEKDHWTVMEVLTAFVREHAPSKERKQRKDELDTEDQAQKAKGEEQRLKPSTDVQAALTVIGRRKRRDREKPSQRLNLSRVDIRGALLEDAHLQGALLMAAHLEVADLTGAHLEWKIYTGADPEGTILAGAHLKGAILRRADLKGAKLADADLEGAILADAHLEGAILGAADLNRASLAGTHVEGVDLRIVRNLTQGQINDAIGDEHTQLPAGRDRPPHWTKGAEAPQEEQQ